METDACELKTIGVLGGLGPQATMDFEVRVHRVARRLIRPHFNAGYPGLVVHYCRHAPFVVAPDGTPLMPIRPDPRLLEAARWLGTVADFLVIPSNGVHLLQPQIEQASGRPVVSMIDATLAEVARRGWRRVGVLGLGEPVVYTTPLSAAGVVCETLNADRRQPLDEAIFRMMEGGQNARTAATARAAVDELRGRGVDGAILGCTELPLLLGDAAVADDLINPIDHLADAAVRAAMSTAREAG